MSASADPSSNRAQWVAAGMPPVSSPPHTNSVPTASSGRHSGVNGGDTVYTDHDTFLDNVAAGFFENPFDDAVPGAIASLSYAQGGFAYTVTASTDQLFNDVGLISTNLAGDSIVVTFTGDPVTAVGGNFWATDIAVQPTGTGITITLSDGTTESFVSTGPTDFRGFTTVAPITTISIDAPDEGGTPFWPTMDNLVVGEAGGGTGGGFPPDENFDEVTAPALPAGFTTAASGAGVPWVTTTASADSAPNSAFTPDEPATGDASLTSPSFAVSAGATVSFALHFNMEGNFDGAHLEIAIDGGGFQEWTAAGGTFESGGYNDDLITFSGCAGGGENPLGDGPAWTGTQAFGPVNATFPASAAGHNVQLRWRAGYDCSATASAPNGVWVDTIHVTGGGGGGTPAADVSPDSLTVSVAAGASTTAPLTISNTGGGTLTWSMTEATAAVPMGDVLYDQNDNDGLTGSVSQDFEAANDGFDAQGADDFVVPAGETWTITGVDATGVYFNGPGPAASFTVAFFNNSGTLPGTAVTSQSGLAYTDTTGFGSPVITLSSPVVLTEGTYWVSIQARMDFTPNGEWGWEDRTVQSGSSGAWQNPGGGFGACPTWGPKLTCIPTASGPDFMFRLHGTTGGGGGGGCLDPSDVPWLSESPSSGSVDGGDSEVSTVTVDATSLAAGSYSAHICVATNDTANPLIDVPVTANVGGGGGDPAIAVSPPSLSASLAPGGSTDQTLTISNTGGGSLDWSIDEATAAVQPKHGGMAATVKGGAVVASGLPTYALWAQAGKPAFPAHPPGQVHAPTGSLTVFTTLGDFQNAVANPGALASEDFEGGLTPQFGLNTCNEPVSSASNDVCFTPGQLVDGFSMTSSSGAGIVVLGDGFLGQTGTVIGANTFTDTTNIAFSPAVTALAFDALDGTGPGPVTVTAFDSGGGVIGSADITIGDVSNNFIGLISPVPVASVTLDGANGEGELINDMLFGDAGGGGGGGCLDPSDVPWLSESPTSGSTAGGASSPVTVSFNAGSLAAGSYHALLCVSSNDTANPLVEVPVDLTVTGGSGGFPPDENFDEGATPTLPAGWTTTTSGSGTPWATTTQFADTAPNSAFSPDHDSTGDASLVSPAFTLTPDLASMTFRLRFNTEASFDGARLEISVNGGGFQEWTAAGGSFQSGGYNDDLVTFSGCAGAENPLGDGPAWTGSQPAFETVAATFPAAAVGQSVQLRWRVGFDCSVEADAPNGVWVDTIHLGTGGGGDPVASVTPTSLDFTVAEDATASDTLNIANTGGGTLTFSITARETTRPALVPHVTATAQNSRTLHRAALAGKPVAAKPLQRFMGSPTHGNVQAAAPWAPVGPDGSVTFQADDGTFETAVSLNNQVTQFPAIWMNRYSATSALTIDSISVEWPDAGTANGDLTGLAINLVAYYDADADGDPTNAVRLGTDTMISIGAIGSFETYPTNFSVPGSGDVYIGFVDAFASGGTAPILFAAALDENGDPNVGWVSGKTTNEDPDLDNLANNDLTGTIASASGGTLPGVWMVRATGGGGTGGPCTGPVVTWLTASPATGSVNGGQSQDVTVTVNPAAGGLTAGDYTAELCITTNDPAHALISVPVSVTVTPGGGGNDGIFCSGFENGEDGSCDGGGGGTPGVYTDRATFLENVAAGYFENPFDDAVPGAIASLSYDEGGFAYTVTASTDQLFNDVGLISTNLAGDSIVVTFSGNPVTAVGGNFWATDISVQPTGTGITITLSDGTTESFTSTGPTDFRGFVTAAPITTISIDAPDEGGTPFWPTMDNLIVGSAQ